MTLPTWCRHDPLPLPLPRRTLAAVTASTEYEVRNRIGTLIFTSPDLDIAKAWLRDRALQWPGAQVEEVVRWESRRRVFKPVAYLRAVR